MFRTSATTDVGARRGLWRSRWAAIGAAIAVSLGAGGFFVAQAAPGPSESTIVTVTPERILDTRDPNNIGLSGPFVSAISQKLQVTGSIPTATGTKTVVPTGATGVLLNVTPVNATAGGFISIRPGDATGAATTSSLNFPADGILPNAVQVGVPTSGPNAGKIDITFDASGVAGPTTDILIDVVGYMTSAGLQELVTDVAAKANAADVYTKTQVDAAIATKANAADVYTKTQVDAAVVARAPIARSAQEGDVGQLANNAGTDVLSVTIDAPVAGILQVVGSALIDPPVAPGRYQCDLVGLAGLEETDRSTTLAVNEDGSCATNGAVAVPAGSHTISLRLAAPAAATTAYDDATLDVVFIPGGSVSASLAEASASSDD